MRRLGVLLGMSLVLTLSACGSTVQRTNATAPDARGPGEQGLGPAGPELRPSGLPTSTFSPGDTGTVAGPTSGAPGSPSLPGSPTLPTSGPGFTAKEIFIGVAYDSTFSKELDAAGAANATTGDQRQQVSAIVADINARGGIAGRKVVPVFYDTKGLNSLNDANTIAQAACAAWTEDRRVFAAMTYVVQMDNEVLYSCLAKRRVIFVPLGGESAATFSRYSPYLWSPAGVRPERVAPVWMQRLAALGYFGGWNTTTGRSGTAPVKIGLLYGNGVRNNQPQLDTSFVQSVKKALAQQGRRVSEEFQVTNNQADEGAAVLRFKNAGITHVIGDYSIVNFTQPAESQLYRPRYGYTSFGGGVALKLFSPSEQLRGALGVGFFPPADVENAQDPGDVSPAEARCRAVMTNAGQPTSSRLGWFAMTWACDTFSFLAATIPASGLSPAGFPRAAMALGSMLPAGPFAISFPDGRPDGNSAARDTGYRDDCSCFVYLSKQDHHM